MARTETVEFTNMCIEYDLVSYISVDELLKSGTGMTEIMPVPRNLILLSYQQGASAVSFLLQSSLFSSCVSCSSSSTGMP